MFKVKNTLFAQVFTAFLSSQVWGGGSDLLPSFETAFKTHNYQQVNQLSQDLITSLTPKEGISIALKKADHPMLDSLIKGAIAAVKMKNIEKIFWYIDLVERVDLMTTRFYMSELLRVLGAPRELLGFVEKSAMTYLSTFQEQERQAKLKQKNNKLSLLYSSLKDIPPFPQYALNHIKTLMRELSVNKHINPQKKFEKASFMGQTSLALSFSLLNQYHDAENYPAMLPLISDSMEFLGIDLIISPPDRSQLFKKMVDAIVDHIMKDENYDSKRPLSQIPELSGLLEIYDQEMPNKLKKFVDMKVKILKEARQKLEEAKLKKAKDEALIVAKELLEEEEREKAKKDAEDKKRKGLLERARQKLEEKYLLKRNKKKGKNSSLEVEPRDEEKSFGSLNLEMKELSLADQTLLKIFLKKEEISEQEKQLEGILKEQRKLEKRLNYENKAKNKSTETSLANSLETDFLEAMVNERRKELEYKEELKQQERLSSLFNKMVDDSHVTVFLLPMQMENSNYFPVPLKYIECPYGLASLKEFTIKETGLFTHNDPGILTELGMWYPIVLLDENNNVSGFTIDGLSYQHGYQGQWTWSLVNETWILNY